jgi:hypothetical protein
MGGGLLICHVIGILPLGHELDDKNVHLLGFLFMIKPMSHAKKIAKDSMSWQKWRSHRPRSSRAWLVIASMQRRIPLEEGCCLWCVHINTSNFSNISMLQLPTWDFPYSLYTNMYTLVQVHFYCLFLCFVFYFYPPLPIVKRLIWNMHTQFFSIVHEVPAYEDMFLQFDHFNVIICLQHSTKLWHL